MKKERLNLSACLKISFVLMTAITISGCAVYSKAFDCQYEKGLGCKSITEVNALVDQGQFKDKLQTKGKTQTPVSPPPLSLSYPQGQVWRLPEEPLSIWIAPFLDEQGDFHEASRIHTVIRPGVWKVLERSPC